MDCLAGLSIVVRPDDDLEILAIMIHILPSCKITAALPEAYGEITAALPRAYQGNKKPNYGHESQKPGFPEEDENNQPSALTG